MAVALVVGALLGLVFVGLLLVASTDWARERLPDGVRGQGPVLAFSMLGVAASGAVSRLVHDDSWWLFWVQLAASLAVMVVISLPLRRRLGMTRPRRG